MQSKKYKTDVDLIALLQEDSQLFAVDAATVQASLRTQVTEMTCELSNFKKARWFQNQAGQYRLEILKFDSNGQRTESGVILDEAQFVTLHQHFGELQQALLDAEHGESVSIKTDVGKLIMATVKSEYMVVDIRKYFFPRQIAVNGDAPQQDPIPTRRGISLTYRESIVFRKFCCEVALTLPPVGFYAAAD